jgi:magnesium transporter
MLGIFRKAGKKVGLPPGTLVHIGEKKTDKVKITVIDYDKGQLEEKEVDTVEECFPFKDKPTVTWINIGGIHQVEVIDKIGRHFNIHPLVMEDIVHTEQRPKMENFDDYIFIILKMLSYNKESKEIASEQISIVLGSNFVITFQEKKGDLFDPVRERLRQSRGRIRNMKADYLAYALVDTIVDHYFVVLEGLGEKIEEMEVELTANPTKNTSQSIHNLKKELIFLRKSVWPLREVINTLERGELPLVHESTGIYLRDVYDHTIQVIETVETFRDMASGMLDIYLSSVSNKMNEVMKVLTIIATIFIPLTFIAGIYGMNFKYMPELEWHWGYPVILGVMVAIGVLMLIYFRRKKWL